jgi:hypothetical protein
MGERVTVGGAHSVVEPLPGSRCIRCIASRLCKHRCSCIHVITHVCTRAHTCVYTYAHTHARSPCMHARHSHSLTQCTLAPCTRTLMLCTPTPCTLTPTPHTLVFTLTCILTQAHAHMHTLTPYTHVHTHTCTLTHAQSVLTHTRAHSLSAHVLTTLHAEMGWEQLQGLSPSCPLWSQL